MYWTDWSLFNIAVDKKRRLRIVDAENIIVVDSQKILEGIILQQTFHKLLIKFVSYFRMISSLANPRFCFIICIDYDFLIVVP